MKALIKSIVPAPLICKAVTVKNRFDLNNVPKVKFDTSNLSGPINLEEIWQNQEIEKQWEIAHGKIAQHVNDTNMWGRINPGDRRALFYLIVALKPKRVLEVGTHIGASTMYIAQALKHLDTGGTVTTVDILDVNAEDGPWKNSILHKPPAHLAKELDCGDFIEFRTENCLDYMGNTQKKFDLIFLDGDHSTKAVYQEISAALSNLNPSGKILLHDYYPEGKPLFPNNVSISGPFLAGERIKKETPQIDIKPLGNMPWPTKEGIHATSLALVTRR